VAIAWYAHRAGPAPAGAAIENAVLRWQPAPGQEGDYQVNVVVTDGKVPCCQLLTLHVLGPGGGVDRLGRETTETPLPPPASGLQPGPGALRSVIYAIDEMFDALNADLMVLLVVPWVAGIVHGLRNRATTLERVLILSILIVTTGLVLGRHTVVAPGSARRYCMPMIALTIFFLPAGLDILARLLNRVYAERWPSWFCVLVIGAILLCAPKLILTPLRGDKAGCRAAGEWLRRNTPADAAIADPDGRIRFYADRPGLLYEQYPDWRRADFVVRIVKGDSTQPPQGWTSVYSVAVGPRDSRRLVVYAAPAAKR
ncbi:MAG: hypothetical protein ACM3VT_04695, partial [Solirubrobacterales bacterium]